MKACLLAYLLPLTSYLLFYGCAGLVQKGGDLLEGNSSGTTVALYRSLGAKTEETLELKVLSFKDEDEILEITSSFWPGFALRGTVPDPGGNFDFTELHFLSSHVHGWNEFTLDLLGRAVFNPSGNTIGILRINGEVERVQISSGRIRLKSSRITGATALSSLRNRRERILALTEWMGEWLENRKETAVFADQREFEDYWKPRLFPELVSKKKRPPEYTEANAEWGRADSVKWNLSYTGSLFPEGLWEYRNSGALLRDWEEALPWIYMEYSWNSIITSFNEQNLIKIN